MNESAGTRPPYPYPLPACTFTDFRAAWPIADEQLAQLTLDLVQQASHYRQLKKGANEGMSSVLLKLLPAKDKLEC